VPDHFPVFRSTRRFSASDAQCAFHLPPLTTPSPIISCDIIIVLGLLTSGFNIRYNFFPGYGLLYTTPFMKGIHVLQPPVVNLRPLARKRIASPSFQVFPHHWHCRPTESSHPFFEIPLFWQAVGAFSQATREVIPSPNPLVTLLVRTHPYASCRTFFSAMESFPRFDNSPILCFSLICFQFCAFSSCGSPSLVTFLDVGFFLDVLPPWTRPPSAKSSSSLAPCESSLPRLFPPDSIFRI